VTPLRATAAKTDADAQPPGTLNNYPRITRCPAVRVWAANRAVKAAKLAAIARATSAERCSEHCNYTLLTSRKHG